MVRKYYPNRFCKCGKRIEVKKYHSWYGIPKFCVGHARLGLKHKENCSCCICRAKRGGYVGKGNPSYGKHQSKETKRKREVSKRKTYLKNIQKSGKSYTEESIERYRVSKMGNKNPAFGHYGEKNYNWKGGISFLPYPFNFNEELKELIRKRDNHTCQLCGKTKEENKQKLSVHHIDYDKDNLDPKNLISLCRSCNAKVNRNRKHWTKFFSVKLKGFTDAG